MRILMADDDVVTRRVLEKLLLKWGHELVIAKDGLEAWAKLQSPEAPHLVVLDWMMPGLDGVEVCRQLRTLERDIRPYVVLLTALKDKKDLVRGFEAGADDYVTKPFDAEELNVRIRAGERIIDLQIESVVARNALRKQATHDFLTGLRNKAAILEELNREFSRAPRMGLHVGVVMADIDHFKQVNDTFGHQVGDKVLAEVARRMASEVRTYESIGRYGGEEFLAILSGCDMEGARTQAERLRSVIAARPFEVRGTKIPITLSLGVASTCDMRFPSQELAIEMADVALYRAKNEGRNRVACATPAMQAGREPYPATSAP